ncbi:unnamed protein product [Strongylus vulgaris]|uniref:SCP domain-containing protein n=1 Tax=Strongylus vulgaris TaxID=40348 RepID=A0A3P7LZK0_STRVU|nr:unnamed protein product [Strongylus vulgaris]
MYKMSYNCTLEEIATKHATNCAYGHTTFEQRLKTGENLYGRMPGIDDKTRLVDEASNGWFSELADYGVGQQNIFTEELQKRPNTKIGHYVQMVWGDTISVGCAAQNCGNFSWVVCNYYPT